MNYNIKKGNSNNKGITLISLAITVTVLIIITSISVDIAIDSLYNTRLKGFYRQLEIIQKRVDDISTTNETYINDENEIVYLKTDFELSKLSNGTEKKAVLDSIIQDEDGLDSSKFSYFTKGQLGSILGLTDMEYNVFVDFDTRTIIAEKGIKINGEYYYILKNETYFVNQDTQKNKGNINYLRYDIKDYGSNSHYNQTSKYRILVTPSNTVGDLPKAGILKYKKTTSKYWETSYNFEMIISELTQYDIKYIDNNNNTISERINIESNSNGIIYITRITQ